MVTSVARCLLEVKLDGLKTKKLIDGRGKDWILPQPTFDYLQALEVLVTFSLDLGWSEFIEKIQNIQVKSTSTVHILKNTYVVA